MEQNRDTAEHCCCSRPIGRVRALLCHCLRLELCDTDFLYLLIGKSRMNENSFATCWRFFEEKKESIVFFEVDTIDWTNAITSVTPLI